MWVIIGQSKYGREELDMAETRQEAIYLVKEYRLAFGADWYITYKYRSAKQ